MLTARTLLDHHDITLADVACTHAAGRGEEDGERSSYGLVFVREDDEHALVARAGGLAALVLERADAARVASGRPATRGARRALVDDAREALVADPDQSLPELGQRLATSPHHLSRIFRALTGSTISRHRMRLRVRAVLERLGGGERDLARLAADTGFADQAHLWVIRVETGTTPSALRHALAS